jgi:WD40 repeat protein
MLPTDPTLERTFRGHRGAVHALAFNPTGKQLASGGADNSVMVWNFRPQLRAFRFLGHTVRVAATRWLRWGQDDMPAPSELSPRPAAPRAAAGPPCRSRAAL